MGEFDLVPEEYRRSVRWRRIGRWLALAYATVLVGVVAAKLTLVVQVRSLEHELAGLRQAEQIARAQKARMEELEGERGSLKQQVSALDALRGGIDARRMFLAVDRALDPDIRFKQWAFRRAGERVQSEPETVSTGYFLVVPKTSSEAPDEAWLLSTKMEIRGEAPDHARLARFVQRLVRQPEIAEARIRSTGTASSVPGVVNFDLAIVVQGRPA